MKYIFSIIILIITFQAYANEWDVDISQCTKVTVRFFIII